MQSKEKNQKTICTKKKEAEIPLSAEKVAEIVDCSTSLVKKVNNEVRSADTPTGEKIVLAQELWAEGSNLLIKEIKKIVQL